MNIYRGCSHGCIYCDSRSTCYHIDNFDQVRVKGNALNIIHNDLRAKTRKGVVGTGAMSDPYNPLEQKFGLTGNALKQLAKFGFGVSIATKSPLVTRDINLLKNIQAHSPTLVKITITTASDELCRKIEPYAATASERFEAIKRLADNGIFCGILLMPVLPFISDTEENILQIISKAKESGASFIYAAFGITLRDGNREHYYQAINNIQPGLVEKYIATYGSKYECVCENSKRLYKLFKAGCEKNILLYRMEDIIKAYKGPYENEQLSLF